MTWRLRTTLLSSIDWSPNRYTASLARARTVMVWRELMVEASPVWERSLLKVEKSLFWLKMVVMLNESDGV